MAEPLYYFDSYLGNEILKHVHKGCGMLEATFRVMGHEDDLPKVRGRKNIHRADFRVVAKYLRTIYSVM